MLLLDVKGNVADINDERKKKVMKLSSCELHTIYTSCELLQLQIVKLDDVLISFTRWSLPLHHQIHGRGWIPIWPPSHIWHFWRGTTSTAYFGLLNVPVLRKKLQKRENQHSLQVGAGQIVKIYLSRLYNVFVKISKCMCPLCVHKKTKACPPPSAQPSSWC